MKPETKWQRLKLVASFYLKTWLNATIRNSKPLEISPFEQQSAVGKLGFPNAQVHKLKSIWNVAFNESLLGHSIVVFIACVIFALAWGGIGGAPELGDLLVEFWGLTFDVLIILVAFGFVQHFKTRRDEIARHEEVIEDLKRWNSDEAMHRVLGAMRRLNRINKTDFDLSGAQMSDISLKDLGVRSISGSTLSNGLHWTADEITESNFERVDFSRLKARGTIFENAQPFFPGSENPYIPLSATYTDCNFALADLRDAKFDGAELTWRTAPPDSVEELIDHDEFGQPLYSQTVIDRFNNAELSGASFQFCSFAHADFRESIGVEYADFYGAKGLETCVFDSEELKQKIIAKSQEEPS